MAGGRSVTEEDEGEDDDAELEERASGGNKARETPALSRSRLVEEEMAAGGEALRSSDGERGSAFNPVDDEGEGFTPEETGATAADAGGCAGLPGENCCSTSSIIWIISSLSISVDKSCNQKQQERNRSNRRDEELNRKNKDPTGQILFAPSSKLSHRRTTCGGS